jgi:hypothetical protein
MPLVFDVSNDSCATGLTPDRNTIRHIARQATVQVIVDVVDNRRVESVEMWMIDGNALVFRALRSRPACGKRAQARFPSV